MGENTDIYTKNSAILTQNLGDLIMSYAIAFDLDTTVLQNLYPNPSWQNAYGDVKRTLVSLGFTHQQGSVYFGGETDYRGFLVFWPLKKFVINLCLVQTCSFR